MLTDFAFLPAPWRSRHISYDDGVGRVFNNSSKTKSNQFLRHPSYQGRKKENGEQLLVLFYSSYYREKWEEGARERAEHVENMAAASST